MDCRKAEELILSDYVDGELKGELLRVLEEHLHSCPACQALASQTVDLGQAVFGGAVSNPPERVWLAVRERISVGRSSLVERAQSWLILFFGEPRRVAFSVTLAMAVVVAGLFLPGMWHRPVAKNKDVVTTELMLASAGAFLADDDDTWADGLEYLL
ncbi:MAG: hypothetical protein HGA80_02020 [Candidatus Omnitrophica bacterium]|nr:hypothetical protein [Candidatus Omnitrophota bacterium]